jgi:general secretion pathway protein D
MPSGGQEFSSFVTIQFDERSNALILSGTVDDIRMLRELINKIDVVLPQVLVEVVIAEVTLTDKNSTGLKALGLDVATSTTGARGIGAFTGTVGGWAVSKGTVDPLAFSAAMSDVGSKGNVKILSQPTIMTMHNKEGQVTVGQKTPIVTGTTSTPISTGVTGSSNFATQQQVTYTDIAIDLKVTPLIGDDGTIQLKIDQKVDDVLGTTTINENPQPIIGHRQATSFVNVKDGEMVVLGGLQRVKNDRSRTKLGLLYEIPVVSQLLGGRTKNEERTELLLFVRPRVVSIDGGTENTKFKIDQLSNKDNIHRFLDDPKAPMKDTLSEKIK